MLGLILAKVTGPYFAEGKKLFLLKSKLYGLIWAPFCFALDGPGVSEFQKNINDPKNGSIFLDGLAQVQQLHDFSKDVFYRDIIVVSVSFLP